MTQHTSTRRRRHRRRSESGASPTSGAPPESMIANGPSWLSFPVVLAFALGILIMGVFFETPLRFPVFVIGMFCLGLALSRYVLRWWVTRQR